MVKKKQIGLKIGVRVTKLDIQIMNHFFLIIIALIFIGVGETTTVTVTLTLHLVSQRLNIATFGVFR